MSITGVVIFCVISAILALVLRQYRPEFAMLLSMACGVVVILYLMDSFALIKEQLEGMLLATALPPELLETVFKALGICILTELAAQSCRDAGENAIALKAELAGKIAVMMVAMPLFYRLLQTATGLLSI